MNRILIILLTSLVGITSFFFQPTNAEAQMYMPSQLNSFQKNAIIKVSIHSAESIDGLTYADITNKKIGCTVLTPDADDTFQMSSYNRAIKVVDNITNETSYFECTPGQYANIKTSSDSTAVSTAERWIIWILMEMFAVIMNFGIFLLRWSAWLLGLMLGQGVFINNELVKEAWPFVQGIANLGFIVALLYIAFATTLRLQSVSTSVQRLLPKLLVGALLVNFSLVIGGLLIDASRLFMAVEMNMFGGSATEGQSAKITPENLGEKLLERSHIYDNVFVSSSGVFNNSTLGGSNAGVDVSNAALGTWGSIFTGIRNLVFVWMVAIGLMVIALGLFWRYIMLLLLLIVSPLAYVAIALPQTNKYFTKWWSEFLKWVTYGPAMLFMLIMIVRVQSIDVSSNPGDPGTTGIYSKIVSLLVTVTLMLVAAKMATSSSGAFANSFMGMVNKTGAWARKNPKMALTVGSGGLLAPVMGGAAAAQYFGGAAKNNVRDFAGAASSNLIKKTRAGELFGKNASGKPEGFNYAAKFIAGPERDEKGKLKKGESSVLSPYGNAVFNTEAAKDARKAATAAVNNVNIDVKNDSALTADKLMKKSTATALSKDQLEKLVPRMNEKQLKAVLSHSDVVSKLDDKTKSALLNGEYGGANIAKMVDSRLRGLENTK